MLAIFRPDFGYGGTFSCRGALLLVSGLLFCPVSSQTQIPEKSKFLVHVVRIKRVGDGCTAVVQSDKVRYELSSDTISNCEMLRASEDYKAVVAATRDADAPNDHSQDYPLFIIENNKEPKGRLAAFDIDSQEARQKK